MTARLTRLRGSSSESGSGLTGVGPMGPQGPQGPAGPSGSGGGDVVGPSGAIKDDIMVFGDTTGKLAADGGKKIADLATTDHSHSNATEGAAGFESAADKTKLDGIASGANDYILPEATDVILGGVKVGTRLSMEDGVLSADVQYGTGHTIQNEESSLPARQYLDFVGAGVSASDDEYNDRTIITVPGGGAGATDILQMQVFS